MKYKEDLINPSFFQNPLEIKGFSDEDLISFIEKMLFIRLVENKLALEKRNNVIKGPVHLGVGQEAIPVAVSHFLREKIKFLELTDRMDIFYLWIQILKFFRNFRKRNRFL